LWGCQRLHFSLRLIGLSTPSLATGQKAINVERERERCKGTFTCTEAAPGGMLTMLGGEVDDLRAVCKQRTHKSKRRQCEEVSIERRGAGGLT